ncbi:hypothetical protein [Streptomyces sp. SYSU K217416]
MASPYCRNHAKTGVVSSAWTPMVRRMHRELGHPVRILKVMGLRSDEGPDHRKRPAFRTVQANGARVVNEWLPVKDWPTDADGQLPELARHGGRALCEGCTAHS